MMRLKIFLPWLFVFGIFFTVESAAQVHRFPLSGEDGIPGTVPNSYLIGWSNIEGAIGYEYVLSDNPLCFEGCAGDTRQQFVTDTLSAEFNLQPNKWYYWITRVHLADGDTTLWSLISSFFTAAPESAPKLVAVAPNPIVDKEVRFRIDWALNPDATQIRLRLYDINGTPIKTTLLKRGFSALRFEEATLSIPDLTAGIYFLDVLVGNNLNNTNNFFTLKVVVL